MGVTSRRATETALNALSQTDFYPQVAETSSSMIENRPDWCLSRQRAWGVPIAVFYHKQTGEPLRDQAVIDRIVDAFKEEGCDAWFTSPASRFLGDNYQADDYVQVMDIADVWFDSGSTHAFVLEQREDLQSPADLYLEGSDQHRAGAIPACFKAAAPEGLRPIRALTHGFVLDEWDAKCPNRLAMSSRRKR